MFRRVRRGGVEPALWRYNPAGEGVRGFAREGPNRRFETARGQSAGSRTVFHEQLETSVGGDTPRGATFISQSRARRYIGATRDDAVGAVLSSSP